MLHYLTKKDVYYAEFTEENSKELLDKFDSYLKELPKTFLSMGEIISSVSDYASKVIGAYELVLTIFGVGDEVGGVTVKLMLSKHLSFDTTASI